jgi:uncharacterized protein YciI
MPYTMLLASALGAVAAGSSPESATSTVDVAAKKKTYLVVFKPGPAWVQGKRITEQPLDGHGPYMLSLYTKGVMKFAGPFTDDAGGAYVFEAASEEEADAIMAADPAVVSKVLVPERHPWYLVDWAKRASSAK